MQIHTAASFRGKTFRNSSKNTSHMLRRGLVALTLAAAMTCAGAAAHAQTVNAKSFVTGTQYAGTDESPWPGSAIANAINKVAAPGQTVFVPAGVWLIDQPIVVTKSSFTLKGDQQKTVLRFVGDGRLFVNGGEAPTPGVTNVVISNFTMNTEAITADALAPIHVRNCSGCRASYNQFGDRPNGGAVAVLMFEGGSNGTVNLNSFTFSYVQINPLGGTPNSGFLISQNNFNNAAILTIGINASRITRNTMTNTASGGPVMIRVASPNGGMSSDMLVDYNSLDATLDPSKLNFAMIAGVPQDPGLKGTIKKFYVRNNTLRGSIAYINAQVAASSDQLDDCIQNCRDLADTYDFQVTGNTLDSRWTGSVVDVRGGTYGFVNGATVSKNTFVTPVSNAVHRVLRDDHSYNIKIGSNISAQAVIY